MPVYKNLGPFNAGEDILVTDTVTVDGTPAGAPVDVSGWGGDFFLFFRQGDATPIYAIPFTVPAGPDGRLQAVVPSASTALLSDRGYFYDFRRTDSGNNVVVTAGWAAFQGGVGGAVPAGAATLVSSFNARTGAVVLTEADVDGLFAGGAAWVGKPNVFTQPQTITPPAGGFSPLTLNGRSDSPTCFSVTVDPGVSAGSVSAGVNVMGTVSGVAGQTILSAGPGGNVQTGASGLSYTTIDGNVSSQSNVITLTHNLASGNASSGFGSNINIRATAANVGVRRNLLQVNAYFTAFGPNATQVDFKGQDQTGSTGPYVSMSSNGSGVKGLGFYGHAPVAQQVLATGAGHTADDIITALQNLGLLRQS